MPLNIFAISILISGQLSNMVATVNIINLELKKKDSLRQWIEVSGHKILSEIMWIYDTLPSTRIWIYISHLCEEWNKNLWS